MMTPEEFFNELWGQEVPEQGFNKTAMLDFAEDFAKAYALHVLERVENKIARKEKHIFGEYRVPAEDIESIFEEIKNELKY